MAHGPGYNDTMGPSNSRRLLPYLALAAVGILALPLAACIPDEERGVLPTAVDAIAAREAGLDPRLPPGALPEGMTALKLALVPDSTEAPTSSFDAVATFLGARLGVPVVRDDVGDYEALLQAMISGEDHLALLPPVVYVVAHRRDSRIRPLAGVLGRGTSAYSGFFVVLDRNPLGSLQEMAGKRVAFTDPLSASGFVVPYAALLSAGIDPAKDLAEVRFAGSHMAALRDLYDGRADVAATFSGMIGLANDEARHADQPETRVRILAKTGRIPRDVICVGPQISDDTAARIRAALLAMDTHTPQGQDALRRTRFITGWAPVSDAGFDGLRDLVSQVEAHLGHRIDHALGPEGGAR